MYITVARLFSNTGSIIDAVYSKNPNENEVRDAAIKERNWILETGEYINTVKEWIENR